MIRLLLPHRFQNLAGSQLIGVGLVGWCGRGREGERVKNLRFGIVRVPRGDIVHCTLVRKNASPLVLLLVVVVELTHCLDVGALALGRASRESYRGIDGFLA